jgi:hypothetical protein
MIKKNLKRMLVACVTFASVSMMSPVAHSADLAPGEGAYLGAFFGVGGGIVQPKYTEAGLNYEATEGGLGMLGAQGGGWAGYGFRAGNFYFGIEGEGAGSGEEFTLKSDKAINLSTDATTSTTTKVTAQKNWQAGGGFRVGYYINPDTLFAFKGGISVSEFDIDTGRDSGTEYAGGPSFGVSLNSRLFGNLGLRVEANYTDYLTAQVSGLGSGVISGEDGAGEITGEDMSARIGLTYSFFDMNSLF